MFDQVTIPRLVVGGLLSGTGKTTLSLALVAALRQRGRTIQTFKVGPDFTDCAYLARASGRPCRNLDAWMLGETGVLRSMAQGAVSADAAIIEGTHGLFDGHGCGPEAGAPGPHAFTGSTAELARLIDAPVVLVLDVASMGETAAAVALGVTQFDPRLNLVGVILDRVGCDHRRRVVEDAVWHGATIPVLGAFPEMPSAMIPDLPGGLLAVAENPDADAVIAALAAAAERHCDLDLIEKLTSRAPALSVPDAPLLLRQDEEAVRIGVAFDDGFCFYYAENLELLEQAGAQIVPFSPLDDACLPADLDAVYLGGGLTDALVPRLAANRRMLEALRQAHADGTLVYAESGGLICCARSVRTRDGTVHALAGLVPIDLGLHPAQGRTGYREVTMTSDGPLGRAGTTARGHECHSSTILSGTTEMRPAYSMHDCDGEPLGCEGWIGDNLLASYVQLHFGQDPALATRFVEATRTRELPGHRTRSPTARDGARASAFKPRVG